MGGFSEAAHGVVRMVENIDPRLSVPDRHRDFARHIRSLSFENFLSFGEETEKVELYGLNVLIGANGAGKSNLIEGLAVLAATPKDLAEPFRRGGGIQTWINNATPWLVASVVSEVKGRLKDKGLQHDLRLYETGQRVGVYGETIKDAESASSSNHYAYDGAIDGEGDPDDFPYPIIDKRQSVLAQLKDPKAYPEIDHLQKIYGAIRLYRNWTFGPDSTLRKPQSADLPNEVLAEDYGNLFLVLNRLEFEPKSKEEFLARLRDFLPEVTDYKLLIQGGTIQMFLQEGRHAIPATRLSDGTLRWLCLLAILVAPPFLSVIVLEEPELGLHPDMINTLAELLKKASMRAQLIVTTHSDILIDALSDTPESVLVVDKEEGQTKVRRLNAEELQPWLENYRLGRLWMKGQIGGTRW